MHAYERNAITAASIASLVVAAVAATVLAGWAAGLPELTSLYLPGPNMKTNAAISLGCGALANFLLISASVSRARRLAGVGIAVVPMVLGALTLSQHVAGWDLGIDQLLASEPPGALGTVSPNRMGPPASTAFLLLGTSLLLGESGSAKRRALGRALAFAAAGIVILPLMGYAYGLSQLYLIARYTGIALTSAVALFVLAVAVLMGRPDAGLIAMVCRGDEVGTLTRRLLSAGVLLPFGIGWLLARLLSAGIVDGAFAISAMALVLIVGLATLIGRSGATLAVSMDARAAAERALSASERSLREADRQKSEFLATLSHELRNPLAPVRFGLELLDGPPHVAERARAIIGRQVQHLTRLIDDLLDLTRITRNKLQLRGRDVELHTIVSDALDAAASELAGRGHRLETELPDDPVWLHVDPDRVVQILVNLLNNAARYTEPGGTVRVGAAVQDGEVVLSVSDTGVGIEQADLGRVFDNFVQVGTARHGGLGIGLALVKGLAELHGGRVEAHSDGPGRGAEFRVRLPRAEAPASAGPGVVYPPPARGHRILIVDDNRDAADMLAELLNAAGHEVLVAYDGADALDHAAAFDPTVGLLDIGMPHMNGYQLAAELRRDPATAHAFLVAITGWGQEDDRRRALEAGFDAHLTKPASPEQILALVAERAAGLAEAADRDA